MSRFISKTAARNFFLGGTAFFIFLFLALTFDTTRALPARDNRMNITPQVAMGKQVWEENNCIGCHTLMGEGAYFAPELGNVYVRYGHSKDAIKAFIKSRPAEGVPGRRSMPQFALTEPELDAVAEFLKFTSEINTSNWPPNPQG